MEFPAPHIWPVTLLAAGLMSPGYPPLIAHKAELCTPLLSLRLSVPPWVSHPPPGIHWNWPASQKSVTAFQVQLPSLASYILHWKSALRPALDSLHGQTRAFCGRSINQTDSPIERKEAATRKCLSVFFPWLGLPHETVWFSQIKDSFEGILVFVHNWTKWDLVEVFSYSRWFKGWFTCFKIPLYIIIIMHTWPNNFWIFLLFPFHVPILINCILLVLCLPFSDLDLRRTALFLLRKTSGAAQCPFPAEKHLYGTVSVAWLYYVRGLKRKENWYYI